MATVPFPALIFCTALRLLEAVLCPRSPRAFVRLVVILVLAIVLVLFVRVPMPAFELPVPAVFNDFEVGKLLARAG